MIEIKTRKDSAVHVSLSSSKLVKQPDAEASPSPKGEKFRQALLLKEDRHPIGRQITTDTYRLFKSLTLMRSIRGTEACLDPWAPAPPRSVAGL